jgi:hypothetical protein
MTKSPTEEQASIYTTAGGTEDNLFIKAYAGTGKTTTLEGISKVLPPRQPMLALAFNTSIKTELTNRFPASATVKTLNGLGHGAWSKVIDKRLEIVDFKMSKIIKQLAKDQDWNLNLEEQNDVRDLVGAAMQAGLVPDRYPHKSLIPDTDVNWEALAESKLISSTEAMRKFAREALIANIAAGFAGQISFDDQIYLSAMLGGQFPRHTLVLVDEAQDLSPLNHIQIRRVAAGRLIICGDPLQAIYAFRGADANSMTKLKGIKQTWEEKALTLTFRCPKVVVARQQQHAPGFRAYDSNAEGVFHATPPEATPHEKGDAPTWSWPDIAALASAMPDHHAQCRSPIAILCRNNAPLLTIAFRLIRDRVGVTMLGRDIGQGLISLSKKLIPLDAEPLDKCLGLVNEWLTTEKSKALAEGREEKIASIEDRGQCLLAVLRSDGIRDAGDMRNAIQALFAPKAAKVTLSSIHKAKGLEWPLVLHLDPWRIPSKQAKRAADAGQPAALQQEFNLRYVLETRCQHTLVQGNLLDHEGGE